MLCYPALEVQFYVHTASGKSGYIKAMNEVVHKCNAGSKITRIYYTETLEHFTSTSNTWYHNITFTKC